MLRPNVVEREPAADTAGIAGSVGARAIADLRCTAEPSAVAFGDRD
jgi:hypothetical protein